MASVRPDAGAGSLLARAGVDDVLALSPDTESAWVEVIQKMDEVYADLVGYQVELEQKNSELEEAHQFIRGVLASMTDVLLVVDARGRIRKVNKALKQLTGRESTQLLDSPVEHLFSEASRGRVRGFPEQIRAGAIVDCEVDLVGADGDAAPLAMNCTPLYDHKGRLGGMVLIGRPVGELRRTYTELQRTHGALKETQRQLVHSEKMVSLGRLVAGVAHELNNPISFVFGNVHTLKRYGERIAAYVAELERRLGAESCRPLRRELKIDRVFDDLDPLIDGTLEGAERVSGIVKDLRRFSSSQSEAAVDMDLAEVATAISQWVLKSVSSAPEVRYEFEAGLGVRAVKGRVYQILVNLIQNALDALSGCEAPRLVIAGGRRRDSCWVSVRDNGAGVPEDRLGRVFDPFFTTKPVGKGTGLGLYIGYNLAADQGGRLEVANHSDGGAVFTLTLPAIDDAG